VNDTKNSETAAPIIKDAGIRYIKAEIQFIKIDFFIICTKFNKNIINML
jgi:hypothetical protein